MHRRVFLGTFAGLGAATLLPFRVAWARPDDKQWRTAAPRPIGEETMAVLMASAEAVCELPIEDSHHRAVFTWRATHLPGMAQLYDSFAAFIARAQPSGGGFVKASADARQQILRDSMYSKNAARVPLVADYKKHVIFEILVTFAGTDAWIALGYDAWPGTAGGLIEYTKART